MNKRAVWICFGDFDDGYYLCGSPGGWRHDDERFKTTLEVPSQLGGYHYDWYCPACAAEKASEDPEFAALVLMAEVRNY